ncbi:hypothetical protein A3Q56_06935, partial [Intoshia linei]
MEKITTQIVADKDYTINFSVKPNEAFLVSQSNYINIMNEYSNEKFISKFPFNQRQQKTKTITPNYSTCVKKISTNSLLPNYQNEFQYTSKIK